MNNRIKVIHRTEIEDHVISLHGIARRLESNPVLKSVGQDIRVLADKLTMLSKQLTNN